MALIKCPECGKDISDKAVSCPHCGFPISKESKPVQKAENEDSLLSIAYRSNERGLHTTLFIVSPIIGVAGIIFASLSIPSFFNDISVGGAVGLTLWLIICTGFIFLGIFIPINLGIWRRHNQRVDQDPIYYSKQSKNFVFYDIHGKKYVVSKEEPFSFRNNFRNLGELLLFYHGKKINLGFTNTPIETINSEVAKIKNAKE